MDNDFLHFLTLFTDNPAVTMNVRSQFNSRLDDELVREGITDAASARALLKNEMGRDFEKDTYLGNHYLAARLGEDAPKLMARVVSGIALGNHPFVVRKIIEMAKNDDDFIELYRPFHRVELAHAAT